MGRWIGGLQRGQNEDRYAFKVVSSKSLVSVTGSGHVPQQLGLRDLHNFTEARDAEVLEVLVLAANEPVATNTSNEIYVGK